MYLSEATFERSKNGYVMIPPQPHAKTILYVMNVVET